VLQALRRNPFAPEVPCHRVVKTDRSIGGFHGTQVNNLGDFHRLIGVSVSKEALKLGQMFSNLILLQ
jgi:hypothetical protein